MAPRRTPAELETLRDLLSDFAQPGWSPERAEEAFEIVVERSQALADSYIAAAAASDEAVGRGLPLSVVCRTLMFAAHRLLFEEFLSIAGEARQAHHAEGGHVHFGGQRGDRPRSRFTGTAPKRILAELDDAFAILADYRGGDTSRAVESALRFYVELSRIHPFYDGNGRAGRFVVSVYLHLHGWLADWDRIDRKESIFIKRINNVIEKRTAQTDYFSFLLSLWHKCVVPTRDLD